MGEQRIARRHRTLKGGKIAFSEHFASIDCLVRNLSETGACLVVASPIGIPERFDLLVHADNTSRRCQLAWRSGSKVGVVFV